MKTWQERLDHALRKSGLPFECIKSLEGYWANEVEASNEDPTTFLGMRTGRSREAMIQGAIDALICNLQDMSKEDAIIQLVDLYAEQAGEV